MKHPLFVLSSLIACALHPAAAQDDSSTVSTPAATAIRTLDADLESTPALPPGLENEFLNLLAGNDTSVGPGPVIGSGPPHAFTIRVSPPEEGGTEAAVHIQRDGVDVIRRVNVGNARKVLIGDGKVLAERHPGAFGHVFGTAAPAPPPVPTTWLGIATDEAPEEVRAQLPLAAGTGLLVRSVVPDSPAAKSGLQKHDVLAKLDDQLLVNPGQLRALVAGRKDQDSVKITCFRQGKELSIEAKLATRLGGDDPWSVTAVVAGRPAVADALIEPLIMQSRALVIDGKGNVITATTDAGPPSEELKRLQEALKKAGVSDDVSKAVEKNLAEVREQLEKSKTELERNKSETLKRLEQSAEDLAKALERARAAAEKARKEAGPIQGETSKAPVPETKH